MPDAGSGGSLQTCSQSVSLPPSNGVSGLPDLTAPAPSVGKTVIAASSPAELAEFITFSSLALPEYTMALAYEAEHVFTNLLMLSDHEQQIPVVVKLGHDCMQIASVSREEPSCQISSLMYLISGESRTLLAM